MAPEDARAPQHRPPSPSPPSPPSPPPPGPDLGSGVPPGGLPEPGGFPGGVPGGVPGVGGGFPGYHERQRLELCALHALNNLLQRPWLSRDGMERICRQ
ncbi:uncharacterized protein LOC127462856 [Manacus candei]|uniref:uncharacterized protein LOC127462856 n=1 Tax=Manacus candei TaxID=415023 RepID=UPI00222710C9|nr:uncharacterized protein LOC127462856 [Manacus candei]